MTYTPSPKILENYAHLLINFALGSGEGIKPGEVVWIRIDEAAKPLYVPLRNAVLKSGGIPLMMYGANDVAAADSYNLASEEQLTFFMDKYYKGLVDQVDHMVAIISETNKYELKDVDPQKILARSNALFPYMKWRNAKEAEGKFTWTIAMYGTPHMAAEAGMTEEEYWEQIIKACYLDEADPIAAWKHIFVELERIQGILNSFEIDYLHVEGEDIDLKVGIGPNRRWLGGSGRNIPSYELFISPDWRRCDGTIRFNEPLYRYGNIITNIFLRFENGFITEATADEGEALLKEMIASKNADKMGEYSLTDARFSRITKPMGETLFDENMGGEQGNTHLAVGNAYQDSYTGDPSLVTEAEWNEWGYNQSSVHTDIISTTKRTVTAYMQDGSTKVIYDNGQFTV